MRNCILVICLSLLLATFSYSMTLESALEIAHTRSLQLEEPKLDIEKIDGQITTAWSNALPQVEGLLAYQRAWKKSVMFFPNPSTGQTEKIELTKNNHAIGEASLIQPIYTFGRIGAGLKGAYSAKRAYEHNFIAKKNQLDLEVMKRFWNVLLAKEVLSVQIKAIEIADSSHMNIQRLQQVGMLSEYDVLRAEVQKNLLIPKLQESKNYLNISLLSLKEILGIPMDSTIELQGQLFEFQVGLDTTNIQTKIKQRNDIRSLEDVMEMNKNIWIIHKNAMYPTIGSQVKYSWQWSEDKWSINPQNNASSVTGGLSVSIPLFTSGKTSGTAQQYQVEYKKSQLYYQQLLRGATLQYESALGNYKTSVLSESAARTTVKQAEKARQIAQTKLSQGQATPLEFDSARLDETLAKLSLAQSTYQRLVATAETRMALGLKPFSN